LNKKNQCPCDTPGSCKIKESKNHGSINTLETCDTSHDSYYESILESIKIETELQYDPTKYWEKDPVMCKLKIINPDMIIKTKDI